MRASPVGAAHAVREAPRRDGVVLHLPCGAGLGLEEILELFDRKYGAGRTERYHRLRALSCFADAEDEPMPDMLVPTDWAGIKEFFASEAARLMKGALD